MHTCKCPSSSDQALSQSRQTLRDEVLSENSTSVRRFPAREVQDRDLLHVCDNRDVAAKTSPVFYAAPKALNFRVSLQAKSSDPMCPCFPALEVLRRPGLGASRVRGPPSLLRGLLLPRPTHTIPHDRESRARQERRVRWAPVGSLRGALVLWLCRGGYGCGASPVILRRRKDEVAKAGAELQIFSPRRPARTWAPHETIVTNLAGGWVGRANSSSWRGADLPPGNLFNVTVQPVPADSTANQLLFRCCVC